jgi:hypothetical protein
VEVEGKLANALENIVLQDRKKECLALHGVAGNDEVAFFTKMFRENREIELAAEVIAVDGHYALKFKAARPIQSALQLVGATNAEVERARATADTILSQDQSLLLYILELVVQILGIQRIQTFPVLAKALRAVILQAVSYGQIGRTPARIHILQVGPPGVGKSLARWVSRVLNQIFEMLSANSVTPAGLCGYSERVAGNRTRVIPGKLALASDGTAAMEDLQHVDTYSRRHTFGIFCDLIETGRLIRTTFRDVDIPAETALLLDVNPKSTTKPGHVAKEIYILDDLELPLNLLSRVDVVIVIPHDVARQIAVMKDLVDSVSEVGPVAAVEADHRVRDIRVLIAYLRDLCPTVKVDTVTGLVQRKLDELLDENKEQLESLQLAGDFLTRGAKSILKLVAASTRLHHRCEAEEEDVSIAMDIFEEKMRFLTMLEPAFAHVSDWRCTAAAKKQREQRILEHFAGKTVEIAAIAQMFTDVMRRTVIRDLHRLGATPQGDGSWRIPEVPAA